MPPIIHIDQLAEQLGVERRWIIEHWINRTADESVGPVPHFRDGKHWFFSVAEIQEWARRRSYSAKVSYAETDSTE